MWIIVVVAALVLIFVAWRIACNQIAWRDAIDKKCAMDQASLGRISPSVEEEIQKYLDDGWERTIDVMKRGVFNEENYEVAYYTLVCRKREN